MIFVKHSLCWVTCCLFVASICSSEEFSNTSLEKAIEAIHSTLDFYNSTIKAQSTPDSTFTLAVTSGQLQALLEYINAHPLNNGSMTNISNQIQAIIDRLVPLLNDSIHSSNSSVDPRQKAIFEELFEENKWRFYVPQRMTKQQLLYEKPKGYVKSGFTEEFSDLCLSLLLGKGFVSVKCTIPDFCWRKMSSFNYSAYSLTHQLLYFIVAERLHCWKKLNVLSEKYHKPNPKQMIEIFCSNILLETQTISEKHFDILLGDLFSEQSTLCGMMGFTEFFSPDWLQQILSWQRQSGCFALRDSSKDLRKVPRNYTNHLIHKRMETTLINDCSSHFTSLAISAIGQYIRYIVDSFLMKLSLKKQENLIENKAKPFTNTFPFQ